jgi:diphthine synthase
MLSLIGLGLRDGDITQRGVKALERADIAYAELYTNAIDYDLTALEDRTGTTITVLDREQVEDQDTVLDDARDHNVVFLVSGDPLTATTHQDILFRAREQGIDTAIIHAPSILTAVAETGLSIYKFGRTTTLPEPYDGTVPDSPFEVIRQNREQGLHTLLLLDIGMTAETALAILGERLDSDTELLICSELGTTDHRVRYGPLSDVASTVEAHRVPASVIIPGDLSANEIERLEPFKV